VTNSSVQATLLLLAVVASGALGKQGAPSIAKDRPVPIFALMSDQGDSVSIDPMLLIDGPTIRPVPYPCTETAALHDFENQYLKPGTVYSVVFGGAPRGTVSVTKSEGIDWRAHVNSDVRIHGLTMALAVGKSPMGGNVGSRRRPTVAERSYADRIAREILRAKGAPAASLKRMLFNQITVMELGHSMKLIASVEIERVDKLGMEYSLFFVADPVSKENSVVWFQHSMGTTDAEAVYLIDHLNADGTDRMFVRRVFYENYSYEVYKSRDGRWVKEFTSEVFGCL
jgi:hypothetical protein